MPQEMQDKAGVKVEGDVILKDVYPLLIPNARYEDDYYKKFNTGKARYYIIRDR
jgi:hypothetical protein